MARWGNWLWLVLVLILGLVVVELLLRGLAPLHTAGDIRAYEYDAELGVRLKSDIHYLKTTDHQAETVTNAFGAAGFQSSFEGYRYIVVAVGDSYTQGTGLPADMGYPQQLDLMLNTRSGSYRPIYGVVNLGVAGFGGRQSLQLLRQNKTPKPDFILYLGSQNDPVDDLLLDQGYRHQHLVDGSPEWGGWTSTVRWFTHGTEIGKRVKYIVGQYRRSRIHNDDNKPASAPLPSAAARQIEILNELNAISREDDVKLIVSWSSAPGDGSGSYPWLKRWAKQHDVGFADWHAKVDAVLRTVPALPLHNPHSGGHYRGWVNTLIAQAYAEEISRLSK